MLRKELPYGQLFIVDDVIKLLIKMSVSEVSGVWVAPSTFTSKVITTVKRKRGSDNIEVETNNDQVYVQIKVGIVYGQNIFQLIKKLQANIKEQIELFTDFIVAEVNVFVIDIGDGKSVGTNS